MKRAIAVLGTGAIGSVMGADLTKAGQDVLLIDQWPAHVEAMKAHGLRVIMRGQGKDPVEFRIPVHAVHLCDVCTLRRQFDIVFLTSKSNDTRWMVEFIKPYLKSDGVLVSIQNSLNDEWIVPIIGQEQDMPCAFEISAAVDEPGVVKRNTDNVKSKFAVGRLDGSITPQVQEMAQLLSVVGTTEISTNIWGAKWAKLVVNTMGMAMGAITGTHIASIRNLEPTQSNEYLDFAINLGKETVEVSKALGIVLEPFSGLTAEEITSNPKEALKKMVVNVWSHFPGGVRNALMQDVDKGRATEIDYINGLVVKKGREIKVPVPCNETITRAMKQLEEGKLKPSLANLKMLVQNNKVVKP